MTTTALVEGRHITKYHGVVTGEAIIGANVVRDLLPDCGISSAAVQVRMKRFCARPKTRLCKRWERKRPGWVPTRSLESIWIMKR